MSQKPMVFLAAKEQASTTIDLCDDLGIEVHGFLDDTLDVGSEVCGRPVLGGFGLIEDADLREKFDFNVAVGQPDVRLTWGRRIRELGGGLPSLIHPTAVVSKTFTHGYGLLINAFVAIYHNASAGDMVLIDNHSTVAHDVVLEDGAHAAPGARLLGASRIGRAVYVGTNATVLPSMAVGPRSVIGAGAVVSKNIPSDVVAVGVPAKVR